MTSNTVNFYDLAILREVIPFLKLRLRIWKRTAFGHRDTEPFRNVLIVAPCILGDCLSCLPAIAAYMGERGLTYDIVVSPDFRSMAEHLNGVRRVFVACSSYNRMSERRCVSTQDIPSEYDLMIVLRISPGAFKLIKHIKARKIISSDGSLLKYVYRVARNSLLGRPVMQSREIMFEALGLSVALSNGHVPALFRDIADGKLNLKPYPSLQGNDRKILIHAGSGWQVKLWSDERWVELLKKIHAVDKCRFIFVGRGETERSTFERIKKQLDFEIYSLINELDLWELFLVMKQCDGFIGIDSGPRNLAHYADLRSITLLNPAAVKNFMPFDKRDIVVEKQNRYPANIVNTKHGANLTEITADEVLEAYKKLLIHMPVTSQV